MVKWSAIPNPHFALLCLQSIIRSRDEQVERLNRLIEEVKRDAQAKRLAFNAQIAVSSFTRNAIVHFAHISFVWPIVLARVILYRVGCCVFLVIEPVPTAIYFISYGTE